MLVDIHHSMEALPRSRDAARASTLQDPTVPASKYLSARPGASDTLLQSLQGLLFHIQAAHDLLPSRPVDARRALERALAAGDETVADSLAQDSPSLPDASLAPIALRLQTGPRTLLILEQDQWVLILRAVFRQAIKQAGGKRIEVNVIYGKCEWAVKAHRRARHAGDGLGLRMRLSR